MTITTTEATTSALSDWEWRGASGVRYTGRAVADRIAEARSLFATEGWLPERPAAEFRIVKTGTSEAVDEQAELKGIATGLDRVAEDKEAGTRGLVRAAVKAFTARLRLEYGTETVRVEAPGYTLREALNRGGSDLGGVARRVLAAVLRDRLGADRTVTPSGDAWAGRPGVTAADVLQLLDEAATFARSHGPA